jgi:starch phosphorylase
MRKLAPVFNTNRMVQDYTERFYIRALERGVDLAANKLAKSVELAHAKDNLRRKWNALKIVGVHTSGNGHFKVGETMQVEALVDMPGVDPNEIAVQLYAGHINGRGEIENPDALTMRHERAMAPDRHLFVGKIDCRTSGRQGFAIRILPGNRNMATPFEPGLITWN